MEHWIPHAWFTACQLRWRSRRSRGIATRMMWKKELKQRRIKIPVSRIESGHVLSANRSNSALKTGTPLRFVFHLCPFHRSPLTSHHLFHSSFLASASPFIHLVSHSSPFFLRNPFIVIRLIQFIPWRSPSKRSPLCARLAADPRPSLVSRRECPSETKALCRAFDCGGPCSLGRVAPSHRQ